MMYDIKKENYIKFYNDNNINGDNKKLDYKSFNPETDILLKFLLNEKKYGIGLRKKNPRILYINPHSRDNIIELSYFTGLSITVIQNDLLKHNDYINIREIYEKAVSYRFMNEGDENEESNTVYYNDISIIKGNEFEYRWDPFNIIFIGKIGKNSLSISKKFLKECQSESYLIYSNMEKGKNDELSDIIKEKINSKTKKITILLSYIYFRKSIKKQEIKYNLKWPPIALITLNQWVIIYEKLKFLYPNYGEYDPFLTDCIIREIPYDKTSNYIDKNEGSILPSSSLLLNKLNQSFLYIKIKTIQKHYFFVLLQIIIQFNYIPIIILDNNDDNNELAEKYENEIDTFWYNVSTIINILNISFFDNNNIMGINRTMNKIDDIFKRPTTITDINKNDNTLTIYFLDQLNDLNNDNDDLSKNNILIYPLKYDSINENNDDIINYERGNYIIFNRNNIDSSFINTGRKINIKFNYKGDKYNQIFFDHKNYYGGEGNKYCQIQNLLHKNINYKLQLNNILKGNELYYNKYIYNQKGKIIGDQFDPINNTNHKTYIIKEEEEEKESNEEKLKNKIHIISEIDNINLIKNIIVSGNSEVYL